MTSSNSTGSGEAEDGESDNIRVEFDLSDPQPLSDRLLEAVDEHTQGTVDPHDLVLYDVINPESLDTLFRDGADENGLVMFDFGNVRINLWHEKDTVTMLVETRDPGFKPPSWA